MQNIVTEYKVLTALFTPDNFELIHKLPDHWFTESRIALLSAMRKCYSEYGYITPEGIEQYFRPLPNELFAATVVHVEPLLTELNRLSKRRKLYLTGQKLIQESEKDDPVIQDIHLEELYESDYDSTMTLAGTQLLGETLRKRSGEYLYVSTGYTFLDAMMGGEWERRAISILMADPGTGKTALMCNSAIRMGLRNQPSLIFSFEMSKASLLGRMASDLGDLEYEKIKSGDLTDDELEQFQGAINKINQLPIHVIDEPEISIYQMISLIRQYAKYHEVKTVFIDHLQIIKLQTEDTNRELGTITKRLKDIAKKMDIHICILSQKNSKESVWQIRDSGAVPANVDIIIDMKNQGDIDDDPRIIEINFVKNRNGPTGKNPIIYDGRFLRFVDR